MYISKLNLQIQYKHKHNMQAAETANQAIHQYITPEHEPTYQLPPLRDPSFLFVCLLLLFFGGAVHMWQVRKKWRKYHA